MQRTRAGDESRECSIRAERQLDSSSPVDQNTWPHAWAALERARADYDPRILAAAERAALQAYRSTARAIAQQAATAHGLPSDQAAELGELALVKAICQCQVWDIHAFELYVCAAVESELRNAIPAPPSLPAQRRHGDMTAGDLRPSATT